MVKSFDKESRAARAKLAINDVIVSVAGRPLDASYALDEALAELRPDTTVPLVINRAGVEQTIEVTIGRK